MMDSAIITIDQNALIQSVNKNCRKLLQYSAEELIGKNVKFIIPSPYREHHDSHIARYHRTQQPRILSKPREVEVLCKDGTIKPVLLTVNEVISMGSFGSSSPFQTSDTESSNDSTSLVSHTMFVGILTPIVDKSIVVTIDKSGIVCSCSPNITTLFGFQPSEVMGHNISMLMTSPFRENHNTYVHRYLNGGPNKAVGHVRNGAAQHKNGTVFPVSLTVDIMQDEGPLGYFKGKIFPVDDLEAVFNWDGKGVIQSCNQNFVLPLFGYSKDQLIGQSIALLIPSSVSEKAHSDPFLKRPDVSSNSNTSDSESERSSAKRLKPNEDQKKLELLQRDDIFPNYTKWNKSGFYREVCRHKDNSKFVVLLEVNQYDEPDLYYARIRREIAKSNPARDRGSQESEMVDGYKIVKTVGKGTYGRVVLAIHPLTQETVAIKVLKKKSITSTEQDNIRREVQILQKLQHPNVIKLLKMIEDDKNVYIFMNYCSQTLRAKMADQTLRKFTEEECRNYFKQIVAAVEYCHRLRIIHRDIKLENILVNDEGRLILTDFGLSNLSTGSQSYINSFCGSPAFSAPEIFLTQKYKGPEVDIWSLGVCLYNMATGELPFENIGSVLSGTYTNSLIDGLSEDLQDLLSKTLKVNSTKRASLAEIQAHPWLFLRPQLPTTSGQKIVVQSTDKSEDK